MKTPEGITIIPTSYQEIVALLTSDELAAVESPIAERCGYKIIRNLATTTTSFAQADVSVSGMTVSEIVSYLANHRRQIVEFGVRFLRTDAITDDEQDYPEGEEQEPDETVETLGLGLGFGVMYSIYHNFLANRPVAELKAFLKNRRIPKHIKFAKELASVFTDTQRSLEEESQAPEL